MGTASPETASGSPAAQGSKVRRSRGLTGAVKDILEENSLEDVEGLLVNVGVVAALMLSIASSIFLSVDIDQMMLGDYRLRLGVSSSFRLLVKDLLAQKNFTFTVPDVGGTFDIEAALTMPVESVSWNDPNQLHVFDKVFHWTRGELPPGFLYSGDFFIGSATVYLCAIFSVAIFSAIVICALLVYTALVISPVRETLEYDEDSALRAFNKWAMPIIACLYLALSGATIAFFWGFVALLRLRAPSFALAEQNVRIWGMSTAGILIFGGMVAAFLAASSAFRAAMSKQKDAKSRRTERQRTLECLEALTRHLGCGPQGASPLAASLPEGRRQAEELPEELAGELAEKLAGGLAGEPRLPAPPSQAARVVAPLGVRGAWQNGVQEGDGSGEEGPLQGGRRSLPQGQIWRQGRDPLGDRRGGHGGDSQALRQLGPPKVHPA